MFVVHHHYKANVISSAQYSFCDYTLCYGCSCTYCHITVIKTNCIVCVHGQYSLNKCTKLTNPAVITER